MHFIDLTEYSYSPEDADPPAFNVGWLDIAMPFECGPVPELFLQRLKRIVSEQSHAQMRGFHICPFCDNLEEAFTSDDEFDPALFETCLADGRFSSAEIRVRGAGGRWYAAPRMIAHYVEAHGYKPPEEFIEAVLAITD